MDGWKGRVVCRQHISGDLRTDEMKVLSGVVYMTKSRGPRTEPWGTPRRQECREERLLLHLKRKQREDR